MRYGCLQERPLQNRANFLSVIPDLFVSYRVFFSPFSANDPGRIMPTGYYRLRGRTSLRDYSTVGKEFG